MLAKLYLVVSRTTGALYLGMHQTYSLLDAILVAVVNIIVLT